MSAKKEIDSVTGVETTGHVWDEDLRELNKPLPRWWLWTFYVTIVIGLGMTVAYPAWPTLDGYTKGVLGYSQRATVAKEIADGKAKQASLREQITKTPIGSVKGNAELFRFAATGGKAIFAENCAPCHGRGGGGAIGYPNLNDDDWLWGGTLADIQKTIEFGIRSDVKGTRENAMPKYGLENLLDAGQIDDAAEYVLSISGHAGTNTAAIERGKALFASQCADCHGADGKGKQERGSPNLTDGIWLYGGEKRNIVESIRTGRGGKMPNWGTRLDPLSIKLLTLYVHSLGGGK